MNGCARTPFIDNDERIWDDEIPEV
jgi:hypothetical protein